MNKRFIEKMCSSLEWRSEGVMDDDSGDGNRDEGEEDSLTK